MAVLKDFYADKLRVRVFDTRQVMGECAGNEAAAKPSHCAIVSFQ